MGGGWRVTTAFCDHIIILFVVRLQGNFHVLQKALGEHFLY